jgi:hypothetical protein
MYSLALLLVEMDTDPDFTGSLTTTLLLTYLMLNSRVPNVTVFYAYFFFIEKYAVYFSCFRVYKFLKPFALIRLTYCLPLTGMLFSSTGTYFKD